MKTTCLFLILLGGLCAGCSSANNPYGVDWAVATLAYTTYDAAKGGLMKHVYARPGTSYPDFETAIEKAETIGLVTPEFDPSPNFIVDHAFLFKYEGRKAIYYGRFIQVTNDQPQPVLTFSPGELTNVSSFVTKLKSSSDPLSSYLISRFSESTRLAIGSYRESPRDEKNLEPVLRNELNAIILGPSIYEEDRFREITLYPGTRRFLELDGHPPPGTRITQQQMSAVLNRMLLENAYPSNLLIKHQKKMQNFVAIKY